MLCICTNIPLEVACNYLLLSPCLLQECANLCISLNISAFPHAGICMFGIQICSSTIWFMQQKLKVIHVHHMCTIINNCATCFPFKSKDVSLRGWGHNPKLLASALCWHGADSGSSVNPAVQAKTGSEQFLHQPSSIVSIYDISAFPCSPTRISVEAN